MSNLITEMLKITTLPMTMMQQVIRGAGSGGGQPGNGNKQMAQAGAQMIQMMQSFCPYKLLDGVGPAQEPGYQGHAHGPDISPSLPPAVNDHGPGPSLPPAGTAPASVNTGWGPMPSY